MPWRDIKRNFSEKMKLHTDILMMLKHTALYNFVSYNSTQASI